MSRYVSLLQITKMHKGIFPPGHTSTMYKY